jgi:hypothetical protein
LTTQRRAEITKIKPKARSKSKATFVEAGSDFAAEALRRYRAGELSEAAFMEIIKLK